MPAGWKEKEGRGHFLLTGTRIPSNPLCLLFSAQPGQLCTPGSSATVCAALFFDYVPGSSLAEAISYFLPPFRERGG